jgi:hypothetical protein
VNLPNVADIGSHAFYNCAALSAVSLPVAQTIGERAFYGCAALTEVNLPATVSIGDWAFALTGEKALTITRGSTPPSVGAVMFFNVNSAKTVTVRVPSGAVSSYDTSWQDAFKGDNSYITLTIQGY